MSLRRSLLAGASLLALGCAPAFAQQATGVHPVQRETAPTAPSGIRRGDQGEGFGLDGLVGAARRAAEGRA